MTPQRQWMTKKNNWLNCDLPTASSPIQNARYANVRDAQASYRENDGKTKNGTKTRLDPVSKQGSILIKQQSRPMQRSC